MANTKFNRDVKKWQDDVDQTLSAKNIYKIIVRDSGDELIKNIIAAAHLGTGPNNSRYPPYSKKYAQRKSDAGVSLAGNWLRGLGSGKRMLAEKNFSWEFKGKSLFLVWSAPDEQTGIYAEAHNEGLGNMPKREWLHFEATRSIKAVDKAYLLAKETATEEFNNSRL